MVAIDQWAGAIVAYAGATMDTSVLDEIDTTFVAQFKRDALGVPSRAQRSVEDVARIRQQRMDAQKQAQAEQQKMETQAAVAQEHGKAMANNMAGTA